MSPEAQAVKPLSGHVWHPRTAWPSGLLHSDRTYRAMAKQCAHVRGGCREKRVRFTGKPARELDGGIAGTGQQGDSRLTHVTGALETEAIPPGGAGQKSRAKRVHVTPRLALFLK